MNLDIDFKRTRFVESNHNEIAIPTLIACFSSSFTHRRPPARILVEFPYISHRIFCFRIE